MPISRLWIPGCGRFPSHAQMKYTKLSRQKNVCRVLIAGVHTRFGLLKKRFFLIPEEERHRMTGNASFVTFWTGGVRDKNLPLPLRGLWSLLCVQLPLPSWEGQLHAHAKPGQGSDCPSLHTAPIWPWYPSCSSELGD